MNTILDKGTTAIACLNTNRQFIVMEKEQKYNDIIKGRVAERYKQTTQPVQSSLCFLK